MSSFLPTWVFLGRERFLSFWSRGSWWSWSSPDWLDWLARKLQGSSVSARSPSPTPCTCCHLFRRFGSWSSSSGQSFCSLLPRCSLGLRCRDCVVGVSGGAEYFMLSSLHFDKVWIPIFFLCNPLQYFKIYFESTIWKMKCFVCNHWRIWIYFCC